MTWKNKLFFGDILRILREYIGDETVDLVYLDPPFNSNANYNVLFKEKSGERSAAQRFEPATISRSAVAPRWASSLEALRLRVLRLDLDVRQLRSC